MIKRFSFLSAALTAAVLFSGCTASLFGDGLQTTLKFIAVSSGSLTTPIKELQFRDQFGLKEKDLVAVVGFEGKTEGLAVQATWFSPDDRSPPLGRREVVLGSGATAARFSLSSKVDWTPSAYLLQVRAMRGQKLAASGSTQIFVGMTPDDIASYRKSFGEWRAQQTPGSQSGATK